MQTLDKNLQKQVRVASKKLGVSEHEVIKIAISDYLSNFESVASLQGELQLWDVLAAKTMRKYNF